MEKHRPGLVPVVSSTMADSVSSVVSQNHRMTKAGLAVVERSTKENSAWSAANRNHRNYTITAINAVSYTHLGVALVYKYFRNFFNACIF